MNNNYTIDDLIESFRTKSATAFISSQGTTSYAELYQHITKPGATWQNLSPE